MPVEIGMWRIDGDTPKRLASAMLPSEATLEQYLEKDPSLLGERLLVIGRQVKTPQGKFIDLLAMDGEGTLHVLELKRDKTPRDVVAQVLDYGSWVSTLDRETIIDLANDHLGDVEFEAAFEEVFGTTAPDELNAALQLTIVATDLDPGSERIVTNLRTFGVPVGARVNVSIPSEGYVAVGETLGPAERFDQVTVTLDGEQQRLADQPLAGWYRHGTEGAVETDEQAEWAIPVKWFAAYPQSDAYWEKGMFANQNSACKLRQEFTLERLAQHFRLDEAE
ncbi:MAG: endonuclease NucS domain-containing protein [Dermatophilaceae bacterium]